MPTPPKPPDKDPPPDEADLVRRLQRGDNDAFATLYARHQPGVRRRALSIVRDEAAADDVTQDVFLRLWQRAGQWDGQGPLGAWLNGIATNQALMHLRASRRRREQPLDPDGGFMDRGFNLDKRRADPEPSLPEWLREAASSGADIGYERRQRQRWLEHQVENLGPDKREVFRLVYQAEVEVRQAALQLGIPEGTVKSRLYHGRRQIAAAWRDLEREDE